MSAVSRPPSLYSRQSIICLNEKVKSSAAFSLFTKHLTRFGLTVCFISWLSSRNFFQGRGKIYCYANFFCYAIVFGPNFREGQKFSGGENCLRGRPPPPSGRNPVSYLQNWVLTVKCSLQLKTCESSSTILGFIVQNV